MTELDDHELLAEFARSESQTAFATLVARHVNLVYSTALRFTGNPHHAEEISQAVFIILARKAGKLSSRVILSGWIYQAARFTAANFVKGEIRRQRREQEAYMQTTSNEPDPGNWKQMAPLLDEAMGALGETERNAVVLRFFENKTAAEISAALKLTEAAAHKRVNRALEKLRKFFTKRGVASTTAIIAGMISANSVQAAPAGLTKTISAVAVTKGAAVSTSTLTLIKGAMKVMAWTKIKTVAVVGVAFILASGTTTGLVIRHKRQAEQPRFDTPEATFQSSLRAMSKGDVKTVTASYTTEFKDEFMATAGKGKSDAELATMFARIAAALGDFQIVGKENKSDDELILHILSARMPDAAVPMKKVGSDWKIAGNLTAGGPGKGRPQR